MAVLNAADPHVAAMAENCPGAVTFFAVDGGNPLLATHRAKGHRVAYVDNNDIVLAESTVRLRFHGTDSLTRNGTIGFSRRTPWRRCGRLGGGP